MLFTSCGFGQTALEKEYDAYSYHNSFTNQDMSVNADFFADDLCVTNTINFNTEGTYARVAQGAGVFDLTTKEVKYSQDIFKKLYPASTTKVLTAYIILKDCDLNAVVTVSKEAATQAEDSQTREKPFFGDLGDTHADSVPIGQKLHHVRGAKMKPSTTPTMVVTRMMFQNVRPTPAHVHPFIYNCTPNIPKMKNNMKIRKALLRKNFGIRL